MQDSSASRQIDDIIQMHDGWKGDVLARLRAAIRHADPTVIEEIKWKMPSLPEGRPVWLNNGILCRAEIFKGDIKLVFSKGAQMKDPKRLFNARLNSKTERAIEFHEGDNVDSTALQALVHQAVELNAAKVKK